VLWRLLEDDKVLVVLAELNRLVLPVTAHVSDEKLVSCTVPSFGTCPSGDLRNLEQPRTAEHVSPSSGVSRAKIAVRN
jgi:hypothetical protein